MSWLKQAEPLPKDKKPQTEFAGLPIRIDYNIGDTKEGKDPETGKPYTVEYKFPYGEIVGSEGEDGEAVDVYIGADKGSDKVFVIHQLTPQGEHDEDKVMLGFSSEAEAQKAYRDHGPVWGFGSIEEMSLAEFENGYLVANRASVTEKDKEAAVFDVGNRTENNAEKEPQDKDLARGGSMSRWLKQSSLNSDSVKGDIYYVLDQWKTIEKNELLKKVHEMYKDPIAPQELVKALEELLRDGIISVQDDPVTKREMVMKIGSNVQDAEKLMDRYNELERMESSGPTCNVDQIAKEKREIEKKLKQLGFSREGNTFEVRKRAGTWAVPDTIKKLQTLQGILESLENGTLRDSEELKEALYPILGDDRLFDELETMDSIAEAPALIRWKLQEFKQWIDEKTLTRPTKELTDPEYLAMLGKLMLVNKSVKSSENYNLIEKGSQRFQQPEVEDITYDVYDMPSRDSTNFGTYIMSADDVLSIAKELRKLYGSAVSTQFTNIADEDTAEDFEAQNSEALKLIADFLSKSSKPGAKTYSKLLHEYLQANFKLGAKYAHEVMSCYTGKVIKQACDFICKNAQSNLQAEELEACNSLVSELQEGKFGEESIRQAASFFSYDWDPGSSWQVVEGKNGKKKIIRVKTPVKKQSIITNKYREGSIVTCLAGVFPFPAIVRSVLGESRYRVQSQLDSRMHVVDEYDLVGEETSNLF